MFITPNALGFYREIVNDSCLMKLQHCRSHHRVQTLVVVTKASDGTGHELGGLDGDGEVKGS